MSCRGDEQGQADACGQKDERDARASQEARAFALVLQDRFRKLVHAATIDADLVSSDGTSHENRSCGTSARSAWRAGPRHLQGILIRP